MISSRPLIVNVWSLKNEELFQTGLVGRPCSLKNKELFQTGLVDSPRVVGIQLVDRPCMEPLKWEAFRTPFPFFCVTLQAYLIGIVASFSVTFTQILYFLNTH